MPGIDGHVGDGMTSAQSDREIRLADALVSLADTLVTDFDLVALYDDLTSRCVELLDVTAAGLMLSDPQGRLHVMASSDERTRLLELLELQHEEGPCLESHRTGQPVLAADLAVESDRWPTFTEHAISVGVPAAYAFPMRLRHQTIGALNLFGQQPRPLPDKEARIAQALADVASIAVLQHRALRDQQQLAAQLQEALNTRVSVEQAKGRLAERHNIDSAAAFVLLRDHARRTNQKVSIIATAVAHGTLDIPPAP